MTSPSRLLFSVVLTTAVAFSFSSCRSVPDHARHIPKEAVVVTGVNLKELSKEIAWSVLRGSKLFEEMSAKMAGTKKSAFDNLDKAGIDAFNTCYLYLEEDRGQIKTTALIPLRNAAEWENYVRLNFTQPINSYDKRKEVKITEDLYASWNNKLLVLMSVKGSSVLHDPYDAAPYGDKITSGTETDIPHALDAVFSLPGDQSLAADKRFQKLEKNGHDLTFWINYDLVFEKIQASWTAASSLSVARTLWKDAASTIGIDFQKGEIDAEIQYYTGEMLKAFAEKFVQHTDRELIERLPKTDLQVMAALYYSPQGIKEALQTTGMLGLLNLALAQTGLESKDLFQALHGDFAFAFRNFHFSEAQLLGASDTLAYSINAFNAVYAAKVGDKESLRRLLAYAEKEEMIFPFSENTWYIPGEKDSLFMQTDFQYIAWSNQQEEAQNYILGLNKTVPADHPALKQHLPQTSVLAFIDYTSLFRAFRPVVFPSDNRHLMLEAENLLDYSMAQGGAYKDDAFQYQAVLHFKNKEESSLIQLLHFLSRISEEPSL